jgi:hypothetical protein
MKAGPGSDDRWRGEVVVRPPSGFDDSSVARGLARKAGVLTIAFAAKEARDQPEQSTARRRKGGGGASLKSDRHSAFCFEKASALVLSERSWSESAQASIKPQARSTLSLHSRRHPHGEQKILSRAPT